MAGGGESATDANPLSANEFRPLTPAVTSRSDGVTIWCRIVGPSVVIKSTAPATVPSRPIAEPYRNGQRRLEIVNIGCPATYIAGRPTGSWCRREQLAAQRGTDELIDVLAQASRAPPGPQSRQ